MFSPDGLIFNDSFTLTAFNSELLGFTLPNFDYVVRNTTPITLGGANVTGAKIVLLRKSLLVEGHMNSIGTVVAVGETTDGLFEIDVTAFTNFVPDEKYIVACIHEVAGVYFSAKVLGLTLQGQNIIAHFGPLESARVRNPDRLAFGTVLIPEWAVALDGKVRTGSIFEDIDIFVRQVSTLRSIDAYVKATPEPPEPVEGDGSLQDDYNTLLDVFSYTNGSTLSVLDSTGELPPANAATFGDTYMIGGEAHVCSWRISSTLPNWYWRNIGQPFVNRSGWADMQAEYMGDAYGVDVDVDGRVIGLNLRLNNLVGFLPPTIGNLKRLKYINLFYNSLGGAVPPLPKTLEFCYLNRTSEGDTPLTTDPHENALTGSGDLHPGYRYGSAQRNLFTSLPEFEHPELMWFQCDWTKVTETLPPTLLQYSKKLKFIYFWYNYTRNATMPNLFDNMPDLRSVAAGAFSELSDAMPTFGANTQQAGKMFVGTYPSTLEQVNLRFARFRSCWWRQPGYPNLSNWTNLHTYSHNFVRALEEAPFPAYFLDGTFPSLSYINASGGGFTGVFPSYVGSLRDGNGVQVIAISGNKIGGSIPQSLWTNNRGFINMNFDDMELVSVANDMTNSHSLRNLRYANNFVKGPIINFDWYNEQERGSHPLKDWSRIRIHGNKYNFADMLWVPGAKPWELEAKPVIWYYLNRNNIIDNVDPAFNDYASHYSANFISSQFGGTMGYAQMETLLDEIYQGWAENSGLGQKRLGEPVSVETVPGGNLEFNYFENTFDHIDNQYQWQKNGENISNGGRISGATSRIVLITDLQESDAGSYALNVTNPGVPGLTLRSELATLTVEVI